MDDDREKGIKKQTEEKFNEINMAGILTDTGYDNYRSDVFYLFSFLLITVDLFFLTMNALIFFPFFIH